MRAVALYPLFAVVAALLASIPSGAATIPVTDSAGLNAAMQTALPGDILLLAPGLYNRPDGALDETPDTGTQQITLRAAAPGVEFRCSPSCFVVSMRSIRLEGITITGFLNGSGWSNITFLNTTHDDSSHIGQQAGGTLLKCGPVTTRQTTDEILVGCRDIMIDGATITQWVGANDMALDFIAGERIQIVRSRATELGRGLVQLKGDTADVLIESNHLLDAGLRGIQVGGSADPQFWRRDPAIAQFAVSNAIVRNNYVEGGGACISLVNAGNAVIERNTCRGQGTFLFRFLAEGAPAPTTGVTIQRNAFVGYTGGEMVNQGANAVGDWSTVVRAANLYAGFAPGNWPAGSVVTVAEIVRPEGVVLDGAGVVLGDLAGNYGRQTAGGPGPQPDPNPAPVGLGPIYVLTLARIDGDGIYESEAELVAAIEGAIDVVRFVPTTGGIELVRDESGAVVAITLRGSATTVGVAAAVVE